MSDVLSVDNKTISNEMKDKIKYLIFQLGEESYGLQISHVNEIIGVQNITEVPEQPDYIKGIINLRGKIIPVMDIRIRFKKEIRAYDARTCIIVVNIEEVLVGLIIDRVVEVSDIQVSNISPPPKINKDFRNRYIEGIGKLDTGVSILLDCSKLLLDTEINEISEIGNSNIIEK
ncbi:MAG: chemotaxis protein CheW [Vallitaleaceae bacterium]|jgi:purine-binding chemotaxis protein CheW|nr:chemotaxis protein CheW [Vallitaleaceae bacterium]